MMPLISVIVPIYKVEAYLKRCLDSIIEQTYRNLEIILVDDGSPDNCGAICDEYSRKDTRVHVIHKNNGGLGAARNSGIEVFMGEYVMFVDADDYLSLDCVEVLYNRIVADRSDIAVGNYIKVFDDGSTRHGFLRCPEDRIFSRERILATYKPHLIYVVAWGKLYKREIIRKISYPKLTCGEDTWVWGDILIQCDKVSFVNKTLYYYYQRSDSIVHSLNENRLLDSINADLRLTAMLVKEHHLPNAALMFSSCIDRALSLRDIDDRTGFFIQYFDRKTRMNLLKETDFETKAKWIGLFFPYANHIRTIIIKIKNRLFRK